MEQKVQVTANVYADIFISENVPFIGVCFDFGGDDCAITTDFKLDNVLDSFIEANSIPGGTLTQNHRSELNDNLELMKKIIELKIEKVKLMPEWKKDWNFLN